MPEPTPVHRCQVCEHESRQAIEQALVNGKSARGISRQFYIGSGGTDPATFKPDHSKVTKHRDRCMAATFQAATTEARVEAGSALIARVAEADQAIDEVLARARRGEAMFDPEGMPMIDMLTGQQVRHYRESTILAAVDRMVKVTDLRARLAGAIPDEDRDAIEQARAALDSPASRAAAAAYAATLMKDTPA